MQEVMGFSQILDYLDGFAVLGLCVIILRLFVRGELFSAAQMEKVAESVAGTIAERVVASVNHKLDNINAERKAESAAIIETVGRFSREDRILTRLDELAEAQTVAHNRQPVTESRGGL